jgi:hypothetical protein
VLTPTGKARDRLVASTRRDFERLSNRADMSAPEPGPMAGITEQQQQQQQGQQQQGQQQQGQQQQRRQHEPQAGAGDRGTAPAGPEGHGGGPAC